MPAEWLDSLTSYVGNVVRPESRGWEVIGRVQRQTQRLEPERRALGTPGVWNVVRWERPALGSVYYENPCVGVGVRWERLLVGDVVGWSGPNSKSNSGVAHSVRWERQRGSGKVPVSKSKETAHWRVPRPVTSRESLARSERRLRTAGMVVKAFYHGDVVTAVTWDPEPPIYPKRFGQSCCEPTSLSDRVARGESRSWSQV